jgi:GT2 family glycosyltransferase
MLVSAIVVTLDQRELVTACVDSVLAALDRVDGPTECIVVDNGSTDGTIEALGTRFGDRIEMLPQGWNTGFPPAAATGIRHSRGEWVLLVNNDATIEADAIVEMLAAVEARPRIGTVAAQMRFVDRPAINSAGLGVDRLGIGYDRLLGEPFEASERVPVEVFGASGGGALWRRSMIEDAGGIDETFFVYLEDADLAWRAQMRGWRALYVPTAVVHHHHSMTTRHNSPFKHFHVGLNRTRMLAKNADTRHLIRYGPAIVAYDLAYVAYACARDRTLAPLRGRLRGLREWRTYRRAGRRDAPVPLEPARGFRAALRRRSATISSSTGAK